MITGEPWRTQVKGNLPRRDPSTPPFSADLTRRLRVVLTGTRAKIEALKPRTARKEWPLDPVHRPVAVQDGANAPTSHLDFHVIGACVGALCLLYAAGPWLTRGSLGLRRVE